MLELFTTREIVALFYIILCFLVFTFLVTKKKDLRIAVFNVIKVACSPQISIFFILLLLYAIFIIYGISRLDREELAANT